MATQPFRIPETPDYAGFARQNAMLDFSPINNAVSGWQQQQQRDVENKRAEDQLGFQRDRLGMDKQRFSDDRKKNLIESFGNVAMLYDPAKDLDGAQWTGIVKGYDAKMRAHDPSFQGSTPDYYDRVQGPKLILGDSKMAAQQLEFQMRKVAEGRAGAADSRAAASHTASMAQYQKMPPADRAEAAPTLGLKPDSNEYRTFIATGEYSPGPAMKLNIVPEGGTLVATNPSTSEHKVVVQGKPKTMNLGFNDINKISEEGGKFSTVSGLANSFNDKYSGYMIGGDTAMYGTRLGIPIASQEAAQWWQTYDRHKNVVRNELFGAALTASEQAAFDKADITPNMDPRLVKKNLAVQQQIIQSAAKRKVEALIAAGANPEVVQKAYGYDPRNSGPASGAGGANDPLGIR